MPGRMIGRECDGFAVGLGGRCRLLKSALGADVEEVCPEADDFVPCPGSHRLGIGSAGRAVPVPFERRPDPAETVRLSGLRNEKTRPLGAGSRDSCLWLLSRYRLRRMRPLPRSSQSSEMFSLEASVIKKSVWGVVPFS